MTDLHQRLIDGLANVPVLHTPPGSGASQSLWDDEIERVARALLTVIAAHEAEVVGRILDRIDALHPRVANEVPNSITVHICGIDGDFFPCSTRRLTAEIRGELRLSQGAAAIRGEQQ